VPHISNNIKDSECLLFIHGDRAYQHYTALPKNYIKSADYINQYTPKTDYSLSNLINKDLISCRIQGVSKMSDAMIDLADFYHTMLWAYQKGVAHTASIEPRLGSPKLMYPYLEDMLEYITFGKIVEGDPEGTLKRFADKIMLYGFASNVKVEPHSNGFSFGIGHCVFAEHIHSHMLSVDVTCPWGIFAQFLAQKSSGRKVKVSLSSFSERGSSTPILFEAG